MFVSRRGFTLIELPVIIAIVAVLAAILFPVLVKSRDKAQQNQCIDNQKQICTAVQMWAQEHDGKFPAANTVWTDLKVPAKVLKCPAVPKTVANAYVYSNVVSGEAVSKFADLSREWLTADGQHTATEKIDGTTGTTGKDTVPPTYANVGYITADFAYPHDGSIIVGYADGHAETMNHPPVYLRDAFTSADKSKFVWKSTKPNAYRFDWDNDVYTNEYSHDGFAIGNVKQDGIEYIPFDQSCDNWRDYSVEFTGKTIAPNPYYVDSPTDCWFGFTARQSRVWVFVRPNRISWDCCDGRREIDIVKGLKITNEPSTFRFDFQGDAITVYVNGKKLASQTCPSMLPKTGDIRIHTHNTIVQFSDFRVTPL